MADKFQVTSLSYKFVYFRLENRVHINYKTIDSVTYPVAALIVICFSTYPWTLPTTRIDISGTTSLSFHCSVRVAFRGPGNSSFFSTLTLTLISTLTDASHCDTLTHRGICLSMFCCRKESVFKLLVVLTILPRIKCKQSPRYLR